MRRPGPARGSLRLCPIAPLRPRAPASSRLRVLSQRPPQYRFDLRLGAEVVEPGGDRIGLRPAQGVLRGVELDQPDRAQPVAFGLNSRAGPGRFEILRGE